MERRGRDMIRVLFVCTGNTCRSPMAEAILKSMNVPGVEVKSAGVFAVDGNDASLHSQQVLEEEKIIHFHSSSPLTAKAAEWATYILTMTSGHKQTVIGMYPDAGRKTFTLKEFAGAKKNWDIIDPFGGSLDIYRTTYKEIYENIEKAVDKLKDTGSETKEED